MIGGHIKNDCLRALRNGEIPPITKFDDIVNFHKNANIYQNDLAFIEIPTEVHNQFKQQFKESHSGSYGFAGITGSNHHIFDFINQDLTLTTRTRRGAPTPSLRN